jgi:glyoxylase-like metal-dependent hydrolase (beta-lactamase superfamily II)
LDRDGAGPVENAGGRKDRAQALQAARDALSNGQAGWKTLRPDDQLADGIRLRQAPGHTPGHTILQIESEGQRLTHIVDIAHNNVLMFHDPAWTMAFDTNPQQAVDTRRAIFGELAEQRLRVFGFHLPFPAFGHIAKSAGKSFVWVPEPWDVTAG